MGKRYVCLLALSLLASGCGKVWVSLSYRQSPTNSGPISYHLVFTTEPSSSISAGATLTTGGVIEVEDNNGNLITTGALSNATITLSDSSGNGGIAGVTSVTAAGGIATIPNNTLTFEKTGTTSLSATTTVSGYGTLSAASSSIAIATSSFSTVSAFSGPDDPNGSINGTGTAARLWNPSALTTDGINVYILENYPNCLMREYNISNGAVTTLAGQLYNCGYTDGANGTSTLGGSFSGQGVQQMATDGTYVYFVDGHSIRAATISNGTITTIAGSPTSSGYTNADGTSARFGAIGGIYINGTTLYIADNGNHYIRALSLTSPYAVTTVAGNGTGAIQDSSPGPAEVDNMDYFAGDSTNLYFVDYNGTNYDVRQMNWSTDTLTTDATGLNSSCGSSVGSIAVTSTTMYLSCQDVIKAATIGTWTWSVVAGAGWSGGDVDGSAGTSRLGGGTSHGYNGDFLSPYGTDIYIADTVNGALRVLGTSNIVTTLAGMPNSGYGSVQNTTAANTRFEDLQDLVSNGTNLYGLDYQTNLFPIISMSNGSSGPPMGSGWGLQSPYNQVLAYMNGKIYYLDPCKIWEVNPTADTIAGLVGNNSSCVENEGSFSVATFKGLKAIASDQQNLYVFDNDVIKKLDLTTQTVSVLSGQAGTSGCITGSASTSRYDGSTGFMAYMNGNLYFTENCNHGSVVQVNTQTGASSIVAGNGIYGYVNGTLANAEFSRSGGGITSDGQNLYIYDLGNGAIREVNISGNSVTTLFGSTSEMWDIDGSLANARESANSYTAGPFSIYYGYGKLYIVNSRGIRVVQ